MKARGATIVYLVGVFLTGALATVGWQLSVFFVGACLLVAVARSRLSHLSLRSAIHTHSLQPDWVVVLLPTAIAIRPFTERGSFLILGLLVAVAFLREPEARYTTQMGPLITLLAASAVVLSRNALTGSWVILVLIAICAVQLVRTVDARRIVTSLIDGCGLYLVANVILYAAGLRSPAAESRIGALLESTGFLRIIFPLTSTLNTPPTIASIYVVASIFLIMEAGWVRRSLRFICIVAAAFVLISAGTRVPMVGVAIISLLVICLPLITRWLGQAAVLLAAGSAFFLPAILTAAQSFVEPLLALIPGRDLKSGSIASLNGRDLIWSRSIRFWNEWISDPTSVLFGYGVNGQYRSGASMSYRDFISSIVRRPELASSHNSLLQQLFDGGLVGWVLLVVAMFWATARLAKRQRIWGTAGLMSIVAMTALVFSGITEVSLVPGPAQDTFWLLIIFVAVACQADAGKEDIIAVGTSSTRVSVMTRENEWANSRASVPDTSFAASASKNGEASET